MEDVEGVDLPFPLFVKPVAEGSSKGVSDRSLVRNRRELRATCAHVLDTFRQPALVETFLPGREFTVGLLGSGRAARVLGVMEVLSTAGGDASAYTYANKQQWQDRVRYEVVGDAKALQAAEVARAAWQALGCLDAGRVDVRLDAAGGARFIEVNRRIRGPARQGTRPGGGGVNALKVAVAMEELGADPSPDDLDTIETARSVAASITCNGWSAQRILLGRDGEAFAAELAGSAPDVVFNLVESYGGQASLAGVAPAMCRIPAHGGGGHPGP
jgi:hypothetical protein